MTMPFFVLAVLCPITSLFLIYRSGVYLAQSGSFWSLGLVSLSLVLVLGPTGYWMKTGVSLAVLGSVAWLSAFVLTFGFAIIRTLCRDYKTAQKP